MGVKNFWDILESCQKKLPLHHLQNKRVCVDLSCWIVQLQNVNRAHCPTKDKVYLKSLFHRLRALIALNCSLIFVTDGSIPAIKLSTYRRRLNTGPEVVQVLQDVTNSQKAASLRRNMGSEFSCMIKEAKALGIALGIPYLDGIEEAEAQCAMLDLESLCDGCFSSDSDIFLFGARTVYRDICLGDGDGGHVICYEMSDIESKLGFGRNSLISLALLLGSDYSKGIHGLGPESACQIVRSAGDNLILQKLTSEELSFLKARSSKKHMDDKISLNERHHNLLKQNEFLQVIEAYMKPRCHAADSEVVYRVLAQHPFQRLKLQELCAQLFDWPPEKTDEYILPKIAERDLRRFANLRSSSSELGLKLQLHEIPLKSPVAEIIKHRKVQGRDSFEILWDGRDGLKTSIVPADLVERACPEKITEFEERKARVKKRNHGKPKAGKADDRSEMDDIGAKLQCLLLETEQASDSSHILTRPVTSDKMNAGTEVDVQNREASAPLQSGVERGGRAEVSRLPVIPAAQQCEVIDLLSPPPAGNSRHVSRLVASNDQRSIIDLSDSESDASPEHKKKARELRLFLASIRDEFL